MKSNKFILFHIFAFIIGLFLISQIIFSIKILSVSLGIPHFLNFILLIFFLFSLAGFSLILNFKIDKIKNKFKILFFSFIILVITTIIILTLYFNHTVFLKTLSVIKPVIILKIIKFFTAFIILFLSGFSISVFLIESLFYIKSAGEGKLSIYSLFLSGSIFGIILFFITILKNLGLFKTYLFNSIGLILIFILFKLIIKKNKPEIFTKENNIISSQINYIVLYLKISFFIVGFGLFSVGILGYNIFNQITALSSYYKTIFLIPILLITLLTFFIVPLLLKKFKYGYNTTFPVILSASGLTAIFIPLFFDRITGGFLPLLDENNLIILMLKLILILTLSMGPFLFFSGFLLPVNLFVVENLFGKTNKKIICIFISFFCIGAFAGIILSKLILFPIAGISLSLGIIGLLLILSAILFNSFQKGKIKFKYTILYYAAFMLVTLFFVIASISKITYTNNLNLKNYKIIKTKKSIKGYETILEDNNKKIYMLNNKILINNSMNTNSKENNNNDFLNDLNFNKTLIIGLKTYYENELLINDITEKSYDVLESSKALKTAALNNSLSSSEKINNKIKNYYFNDPYLFLISDNNKYDLMIQSYYWNWDSDISRLYTLNYFQYISNSLNKNGSFFLVINNENYDQSSLSILTSTLHNSFAYLYLLELSNKKIIIAQNYKNSSLKIIPKQKIKTINTIDNLLMELKSIKK